MKMEKTKIRNSFSKRLSLYILLFVGLVFAATVVISYTFSSKYIKKQAEENAFSKMELANSVISDYLTKVEMIPENYKLFIESKMMKENNIYDLSKLIVRQNPFIYGCAVAFEPYAFSKNDYYFAPYSCKKDTTVSTFQMGSESYDYFMMDWYQIPKLLDKSYWSEPYYDDGGCNEIIVTYSVPMHDKEGAFLGIFTVDVSLNFLSENIGKIRPYENSQIMVLSRNGDFLASPDTSMIYNESIFSLALSMDNDSIYDLGMDMVEGKKGVVPIKKGWDGNSHTMFYAPLTHIGWSMASICSDKDILRGLSSVSDKLIGIGVIGLLLMFILCRIIIRKQVKPLTAFADSAKAIAKGDFNASLPLITHHDEMYQLKDSFIFLQEELQEHIETLKRTTASKERIESELRVARDIQMSIIPKIFPDFPNKEGIEIYASITPAKEVGGDLYDFFISNEKLYFAIGDVSGKGIPASLLMVVALSLLRSSASNQSSPASIVKTLNNSIAKNNDRNMFITLFAGILDLDTGELRYCNAGHNSPVIITNGQASYMKVESNVPLGVAYGFEYSEENCLIDKNSTILLYTDGITEAENGNKVLFGEDKLLETTANARFNSPKELIEKIISSVNEHVDGAEQSDDLTTLGITFHKTVNEDIRKTLTITNDIAELNKLTDFIDSFIEESNLSPSLSMQLNLAMEETVSNIILYAFKGEKDKKITITAEFRENNVIFLIEDSGVPFDPTAHKDPDITQDAEDRQIGGLGILIVKKIMNKVEYSRLDNINVLKLTKNINGDEHNN